MQVTLTVSDSAGVLGRVENGDIAVGVTGSPGTHSVLQSTLLCEDVIVLVTAAGARGANKPGPLDPSDLTGISLIRREPGSGTQLSLDKALRQQGIDPDSLNWTATLGSTRAVIEGALAGLGGAFLSRSTVARELADGTLEEIPVKGVDIRRGLYVVLHRQRTLSPAASCFVEELLGSGSGITGDMERS